ncbi:MAG TPA: hypothetical protein VK021_04525 [Flavobacteriaceae bacterium]|nr:hypothetical protein [Flavobacteriaceae bacterium]
MLVEKDKTNRWLTEQLDKSQVTISRWCSQTVQPSVKDLLVSNKERN